MCIRDSLEARLRLTDQTQLRFRCDASGNSDYIYIDEVVISAQ